MEKNSSPEFSEEIVEQRGIVSNQLSEDGITNESLGNDHVAVSYTHLTLPTILLV